MNEIGLSDKIIEKIDALTAELAIYKVLFKASVALALLADACQSRRNVFAGDNNETEINEVIDFGLELLVSLCANETVEEVPE